MEISGLNLDQSVENHKEPSVRVAAAERSSFAFISSIAAVLATGFAFSFLPYFLWWHSLGHFAYIADKDNEFYLQLAARSITAMTFP